MEEIWNKLPQETAKAWNAFLIYREMPANNRSLASVTKELGHASDRTVKGWSSQYQWVKRVEAYDAYNGTKMIAVRETNIEEYEDNLNRTRTHQLIGVNRIINTRIRELMERQEAGEGIKSIEIVNLVHAIRAADDLSRRIAGLPTSFNTKLVDEPDYASEKYEVEL